MRAVVALVTVVLAVPALGVALPANTAAAGSGGRLTDPRLVAEVQRAARAQTERIGGRTAATTAVVEVLTTDTVRVAAAVRALGGTVTGDVPGGLVQATVPLDLADDIAALPGVTDVRWPRRSGYLPATPEAVGFGPTRGQEVDRGRAAAWQNAGFRGAGVKVGIVDFFEFSAWDVAEHGPVPDASHQFCYDSAFQDLCVSTTQIANGGPEAEHGVAVVEIVRDMAPDAEIFIASAATVADLRAVIDRFAERGVSIMTRSLGTAYDGPGDGTGPMAAAVDYAASRGITWFNSAGNDGEDAYLARTVTTVDAAGYVNFGRPGEPVDTWLRVDVDNPSLNSPGCYFLDGVRWSTDWYKPASQRTDYSLEVWQPRSSFDVGSEAKNPTTAQVLPVSVILGSNIIDASQRNGARPLEGADLAICASNLADPGDPFGPQSVTYLRVRKNAATPVGSGGDRLEVALAGAGVMQLGASDRGGSASKPVVDSKNPALVSVGAIDPRAPLNPASTASIAWYSSQGPTFDGRVKPDMSAPSGFDSTIYDTLANGGGFSGTSAAAPTAAGAAALVLGAGLATRGAALAAAVKHFTVDFGPRGPDNAYGFGYLRLPAPPTAASAATPGRYVPLGAPVRLLDSRAGAQHVGPAALTGPFARTSIVDLTVLGGAVPTTGVNAVAINLTSTGALAGGNLQAVPYLRGRLGSTNSLSVAAGATRPNFAVVPVGQDGKISVYLPPGGNIVVDVLGYFTAGQPTTGRGRFVPLARPERWMDTRVATRLPASFGGTPRRVRAGESVTVPVLSTSSITPVFPAQVAAMVVTITATNPVGSGFVRAGRNGQNLAALRHANLTFTRGTTAGNTAIVPVDATGRMRVFASTATDVIVDVVGYITSVNAPVSAEGTFVPLTPGRVYSSLSAGKFADGETRVLNVSGGTTGVPGGIGGLAANVTVSGTTANAYLTLFPGTQRPPTATVNVLAGQVAASGALFAVNPGASVNTVRGFMSRAGHVIIDAYGYFVAAP